MSPDAFAAVTRGAAEAVSRRRSLLTLGGAALAAGLAGPTGAGAKAKKAKKKRKHKSRTPPPLAFAGVAITGIQLVLGGAKFGWAYRVQASYLDSAGNEVGSTSFNSVLAAPVSATSDRIRAEITAQVRQWVAADFAGQGQSVPADRIAVTIL